MREENLKAIYQIYIGYYELLHLMMEKEISEILYTHDEVIYQLNKIEESLFLLLDEPAYYERNMNFLRFEYLYEHF